MERPTCRSIPALLAKINLFAELGDGETTRIARHTRERALRRGEVLFHRGDPCTGIHVLVSGQVKLAAVSSCGKEKVVELVGPGRLIGTDSLVLNDSHGLSAEALSDCIVLQIARAGVEQELRGLSPFGKGILNAMAERTSHLVRDVESYALNTGTERVVEFLLREIQGIGPNGDEAVLHLQVSKCAIASRLNVTQEHFSRILHDLQALGLIAVDGRYIGIASIERLRAALPHPREAAA